MAMDLMSAALRAMTLAASMDLGNPDRAMLLELAKELLAMSAAVER